MDYFDLQGLRDYHTVEGKMYNINLPQPSVFYDTREKLKRLVKKVAERNGDEVDFVYSTRPNAQAGRGRIIFQEYVLTGFAPRKNNIGQDLFMKFSFSGLLTKKVVFAIDLDMNFKKGTSPYIKDRDSIYNNSLLEIPIDDNFPQNWDDLIALINVKYLEIRMTYSQITSDVIARLFNLYEKYLQSRLGEIKQNTVNTYLESAKATIPKIWKDTFDEDFSKFSFDHVELKKLHYLARTNGFKGSGASFLPFTKGLLKKFAPPLNQILYGPPGTGKTFKTKELALKIIDGVIPEHRYEVNERYNELITEGQIKFTTFHQSLSYEDFIEGIKPDLNDKEDVIYDIKDGIFKKLVKLAQKDESSNFEHCYQQMIIDLSDSDDIHHLMKTPNGTEFNIALNSRGNLTLFTTKDLNERSSFTKEKLKNHFEGEKDLWYKNYIDGILDFMKSKYGLKKSKDVLKNYVLIIDEINRGNIASIFGELITLIEEDKRDGSDETLEVTLPYSQLPFSVPDNLFIIGTMNTADKSVEALDSALRRRFHFTELNYNSEILLGRIIEEVDLERLLTKINDRVEQLLDKDHKIGHAYFININSIDELKDVFERKIIPLLEEYFFGDYLKIGLVLGSEFIKEKNSKISQLHQSFMNYSESHNEDSTVFEIVESIEWDQDSFKSIYEEINEN